MIASELTIEKRLDKEITSFFKTIKNLEHLVYTKAPVTLQIFLENKFLIILAIRKGIPYSLFDLLMQYCPFSENDWAGFLDISSKSLQRYKTSPTHYFKPIHSEKIVEITEVTYLGLDVFGNMQKLKLWLNTPNYALGQMKPIDLLKDSYGKELVTSELIRINHGILV